MSKQDDALNGSKSGAVGPVTMALASVGAALAPAAEAATFTVTNTNDSGAGSLRQAIDDANADSTADTIVFQAGVTGTITLTTGQLHISESVTITGPGAANLAVSGNNSSRVFYLYNGSSGIAVDISGLTVANGAASQGGGIYCYDENLTLDGVVVRNNTSTGDGGGLWLDGFDMNVTIRNSQITGNTAGDDGGGIYVEDTGDVFLIEDSVISGNTASADGGGIYFYDPDNNININRSTISGNTAEGDMGRAPGGSVAVYGRGGGIYMYSSDGGGQYIADSTISGNLAGRGGGVYFYNADQTFEFLNSTVSDNTASQTGGGIAFYYSGDDTGRIAHSTIADNVASRGGGIYAYDGFLDITHSIVANNTASTDNDLSGAEFDVDFSLIEDQGGATVNDNGGNLFDVDPMLGALANNGGPTQTHLPLTGSPAIDAGDPAFAPPPATDQIGNPRVFGGLIDLGAVEAQAVAIEPYTPVPALGLLGLAAAALGIGGVGAAAARNRRSSGKAGALLIALASVVGLHAPEANAAQPGPATKRIVSTITTVSTDNQRVQLRLGDGQNIVAAESTLEIKDRRRHAGTPVRSASAIAAGQPVLIKVRYGRDGEIKRTVVRLVDSIEAANREVLGK